MAPLPPFLVRIATTFLTQVLTRRLQQSPLFFRIVDRLVHEADHLPHRLQGRPVPPYRSIDPQEPNIREMAQDAWQRRVDDPGEPHDEPSPFGPPPPNAGGGPSSSSSQQQQMFGARQAHGEDAKRLRARDAFRSAQQRAERDRTRQAQQDEAARRDKPMDDLRALLDKMREEQQPPPSKKQPPPSPQQHRGGGKSGSSTKAN